MALHPTQEEKPGPDNYRALMGFQAFLFVILWKELISFETISELKLHVFEDWFNSVSLDLLL